MKKLIKLYRHIFVLGLLALIAGCSTRYYAAPVENYSYVTSETIRIENAQLDTEPRVYFSDGITTVKTHYRGWAEILISKVYKEIDRLPKSNESGKKLALSIHSIMCGGHYIADCMVTALIETDEGTKLLITSEKINSYPTTSALDKALDDTAKKIVIDQNISNYILN